LAKYSLRERVQLMNTINPTLRMTVSRLHQLYRKAGIRFKTVKRKVCWRRDTSEKLKQSDDATMQHLQ
jgi:hypothetical protein